MKILSFGAGMQSTALALMSCENVDAERKGHERPYPLVPVYDLVVFCDLGFEPPWVMQQAEFVHRACDTADKARAEQQFSADKAEYCADK